MICQAAPIVALFEFASLPMLGWLAAAALPWLIHRLYRRQHLTTSWAAVELLLKAMRQRSRRIQMQQWLLLAVRTAILVFVSLAAAEPAIRSWAIGVSGNSRAHRIVIVDQSYSMGYLQDGESRWQRAKAQARQWIESADGNPVTLIAWDEQADSVLGRPTYDAPMALAALEELEHTDSTADLAAVTRAVLAAIDRADTELAQDVEHQVAFCSDFCQPTWVFDEGQLKMLGSIAKRAQVTMVDVAAEKPYNVAVTEISIQPEVILSQSDTTITATIDCFGRAAKQSAVIELLVDGQVIEERQIALQVNEKAIVQFGHRFIDEGPQTVVVRLREVADGLAIDDQRWQVVEVRPQVRVACIAGFPRAADDLARALSPRAGLSANASLIEAEVYSLSRLSELALQDYDAVFLCSIDQLTDREVVKLDKYVWQGGGLAVFLGPGVTADSSVQLQALLPATFDGKVKTGEFRFDVLDYKHPIVSPFRGQTQAGLLGVVVSRYLQLNESEEQSTAEAVLRFESGDAALIVDRFGLGTVAISALPAALSARAIDGAPWSTFAVSPSFLPVVHELTSFIVSNGRFQQRNLLVGETLVVPWSGSSESAEVHLSNGSMQLLPLTAAYANDQLAFAQTDRCGVYSITADGVENARVAVNLDARESDVRSIKPRNLPPEVLDYNAGSSVDVPAMIDFSFVRYLLLGALMLLLVEIGLAWLLGRGWG